MELVRCLSQAWLGSRAISAPALSAAFVGFNRQIRLKTPSSDDQPEEATSYPVDADGPALLAAAGRKYVVIFMYRAKIGIKRVPSSAI